MVKRRQVYDSLKVSVHVSRGSKGTLAGWLHAYRFAKPVFHGLGYFLKGGWLEKNDRTDCTGLVQNATMNTILGLSY